MSAFLVRRGNDASGSSFEPNKELNAYGKIVADRIAEKSEAQLKESEAWLAAAKHQARLVAESLNASTGPTGTILLRVTRGGEVREVIAPPGRWWRPVNRS